MNVTRKNVIQALQAAGYTYQTSDGDYMQTGATCTLAVTQQSIHLVEVRVHDRFAGPIKSPAIAAQRETRKVATQQHALAALTRVFGLVVAVDGACNQRLILCSNQATASLRMLD